MQLDDALSQIADIRERVSQAGTFRGYRSISVAVSGMLAVLGAVVQEKFVRRPVHEIDNYVLLWGSIAIVSVILAGGEMWSRLRRSGSAVQRNMSLTAIEQFVPCLVAGAMVTFVILNYQIEGARLLPGIWMVLFGLGVFASRPILPRPIPWVGGYYLLAGMVALSGRFDSLGPWVMGISFGFGQMGTAGLLYWVLERDRCSRGEG